MGRALIVAVEGLSAVGKSTWCRSNAETWFCEPPRTLELHEKAAYQIGRWRHGWRLAMQGRLVVHDTDPLKLHYAWCLYRLGRASQEDWVREATAAREAVASGDAGFVDLVVYLDATDAELEARKAADLARSRRNFDLHRQFRPHLREWYETIDGVEAGRVAWTASAPIEEMLGTTSPRRLGDALSTFDNVMEALAMLAP